MTIYQSVCNILPSNQTVLKRYYHGALSAARCRSSYDYQNIIMYGFIILYKSADSYFIKNYSLLIYIEIYRISTILIKKLNIYLLEGAFQYE